MQVGRWVGPTLLFAVGASLFFASILLFRDTFQRWGGKRAERALQRYASRPLLGVGAGFMAAAVLQSSSATNIIVVGMAGSGLLTLQAAFAVVLGSNVGTTLTAHLVALPLERLLPYLLAFGAAGVVMCRKNTAIIVISRLCVAIGGLFYALMLISMVLQPLLEIRGVQLWLANTATSPFAAVGAGALLTGVVQSSSIVTMLAVRLAQQGTIPVAGAVAVSLGSNVGTVLTTILASIGAPPAAARVAWADLLFNIMGVVIVLPVFSYFWLAITALADDPGRQVAVAHSLFNVITAAAMLPFISFFCRAIERFVGRGTV